MWPPSQSLPSPGLNCPDIPDPIGCDVAAGGGVFPRQGRVVVTAHAGCGELVQNVLGLIGGHQTHAKQGKTKTKTKDASNQVVKTKHIVCSSTLVTLLHTVHK